MPAPSTWSGAAPGPCAGPWPLSDEEVAVAVAVAACGSRALWIDAGNRSVRSVPVEDLARSGAPAGARALVVRPRPGLLCVDDDSPLQGQAGAVSAGVFDRLVVALTKAGVPLVVTSSGRPGHRHLFAAVGELGEAATGLRVTLAAAGLDVRDQGIRPPGSPHRAGGRSVPFDSTTGAQLDLPMVRSRLQETPPPASQVVQVLREADLLEVPESSLEAVPVAAPTSREVGERHRMLSHRMWRVLREGHEVGGYLSPSHGRMGLAVAVAAAGGSPAWLAAVLRDPRNALGTTFRDRAPRWQEVELARLWRKAQARLADPARPLSPQRWCAALEAVSGPGMAAATDVAVAEAVLLLGDGHRVQVAAAVAEVAVEAGVGVATARRSLRRLTRAGWLRVVQLPDARSATVYRLTVPPGHQPAADGAGAPAVQRGAERLGDDAFAWRALGKCAARILRAVPDGPATVRELADRVGYRTPALRRQLRRLARAGLVVRAADGWVRTGRTLGQVAAQLGTAGRQEAARASLREARAARRRFLESWVVRHPRRGLAPPAAGIALADP